MNYPTELVAKAEFELRVFERVSQETGKELLDEVKRHRASQEQAQQPTLGALAKRRIFDAIRSAYDLGYNDARNAKTVPGDGTPGYKGRDVEADHGGALLNSLNHCIKAQQPSGGEVVAYRLRDDEASERYGKDVFVYWSANEFRDHPSKPTLLALIEPLTLATPKPEPMTDEQVKAIIKKVAESIDSFQIVMTHWPLVIRATEARHGITKEQA